MEHVVDTVIIGGGPAGISCAVRLQRGGVSNIVVEKKKYPRDKTCGGIVTIKTQKVLTEIFGFTGDDIKGFFCDESDRVRLYYGDEMLTDSTLVIPFRLVRRKTFDSLLAARYSELGGTIVENAACVSVDMREHRLVLSNGDAVRFSHIVVSDGALSRTREQLGYKKSTLCFCAETHIPRSSLSYGEAIGLYIGVEKNGYGWVFPSGEDYCIGLGGSYKKGVDHVGMLKKFLVSLGVDPSTCTIKGAFLPYGKVVKQDRGHKDAVLCGDAGGFVDPLSGEGLYYALSSGAAAADAVMSGADDVRAEFIKHTAPFSANIKKGNRLKNVFYKKLVQKLFVKVIRGRSKVVGYFCDNLFSSYRFDYSSIAGLCREYKKNRSRRKATDE